MGGYESVMASLWLSYGWVMGGLWLSYVMLCYVVIALAGAVLCLNRSVSGRLRAPPKAGLALKG